MAGSESGGVWRDIKGCYSLGLGEMSGVVRGERRTDAL